MKATATPKETVAKDSIFTPQDRAQVDLLFEEAIRICTRYHPATRKDKPAKKKMN